MALKFSKLYEEFRFLNDKLFGRIPGEKITKEDLDRIEELKILIPRRDFLIVKARINMMLSMKI